MLDWAKYGGGLWRARKLGMIITTCMMLLQTPQTLKKSGINKGNAMNYLAFIFRIFHVCAEKQSVIKPRDVIGGKEGLALIAVSLRNTLRSLSLPYWLPCRLPYPQNIVSYFMLILGYFFILFLNIQIYIFFSEFVVPRSCSWFYRGLGFLQLS